MGWGVTTYTLRPCLVPSTPLLSSLQLHFPKFSSLPRDLHNVLSSGMLFPQFFPSLPTELLDVNSILLSYGKSSMSPSLDQATLSYVFTAWRIIPSEIEIIPSFGVTINVCSSLDYKFHDSREGIRGCLKGLAHPRCSINVGWLDGWVIL